MAKKDKIHKESNTPTPHEDAKSEFDPTVPSDPQQLPVTLVDGVASVQTYAVLASHGEDRVALRWLGFEHSYEQLPDGEQKPKVHQCINACFKIHIERNQDVRINISQRIFAKFGLPEVFYFKKNRFTGKISVPFSYSPNSMAKIEFGFMEANIPAVLWDSVVQPGIEMGATVKVSKREFAKWLYTQMKVSLLKLNEEGSTRGFPDVKAFWTNYQDSDGETQDD